MPSNVTCSLFRRTFVGSSINFDVICSTFSLNVALNTATLAEWGIMPKRLCSCSLKPISSNSSTSSIMRLVKELTHSGALEKMSSSLPGVPITMCGVSFSSFKFVRGHVPPIARRTFKFICFPVIKNFPTFR